MIEIEKKYEVTADEFRELTERVREMNTYPGGQCVESNTLYSGNNLARDEVLRVRAELDTERFWITYKKRISDDEGLKRQEEIETELFGNVGQLNQILYRIGYRTSLVYEKERAHFYYGFSSVICFDILPFGYFIEIEGEEEEILVIEALLGLESKVTTRSYPELTRANGNALDDGTIVSLF